MSASFFFPRSRAPAWGHSRDWRRPEVLFWALGAKGSNKHAPPIVGPAAGCCRAWSLVFSFIKWGFSRGLANVRSSFLVIEGCLEEGTETPFGWEEGRLGKRGTALQGTRLEEGGGGGWGTVPAFLKGGAGFIPPPVRGGWRSCSVDVDSRRLRPIPRGLCQQHTESHTHTCLCGHTKALWTHTFTHSLHSGTFTNLSTSIFTPKSGRSKAHVPPHAPVYNIRTAKAQTQRHTLIHSGTLPDIKGNTAVLTPTCPGHLHRRKADAKMRSDTFTHSCSQACTLTSKAHTYFVHTPDTLEHSQMFGQIHSHTVSHTQPCRHPQLSSHLGSTLSPHPLPTILLGLWGLPLELREGMGRVSPC